MVSLAGRFQEELQPETRYPIDQCFGIPGTRIKFCPNSTRFELRVVLELRDITFEDLSLFDLPKKLFRIGKHPNDLYALVAARKPFNELVENAQELLHLPGLGYIEKDVKKHQGGFLEQVSQITTLVKSTKSGKDILHKETLGMETTVRR